MAALTAPPTGTVTFLFTDIEGSTRLWEAYPETMRPALARHDALLRQEIEANEGYVFKTMGDAFCAAFAVANDALTAALAAQIALQQEAWDTPEPLRVRMALHTGSCEERGNDYFGPPLGRIARLMATGHGGQVLLSDVTHELIRDASPLSVTFLDLGTHRLSDLGRPEAVFQLIHPALPWGFPPLNSLDNPALPNNLPQQPTSFVGREKEIAAVKLLMQKSHLVTLAGSGGAGKSRLSLQVAADLLEQFPDGGWLAELAPLFEPALVPQAIADALGVREAAGKTVQQSLVDWLRPKRLLLVLDNCEHLIGACAVLAAELLRNCPGLQILASSREPLGVSGEIVYRVPSLSLPELDRPQTVESLAQYEAVTLFIQRAQAVQASFSVTSTNAPAVAAVCHRLDGIPLALELAAARVRSLSVEEVNARLDNRFRLLTGGSRTLMPRQQTLRALIDWSYDLLTGREKTVLCCLSVFAGGWTLEAAENVCSRAEVVGEEPIEDWEVLDLLTSVADKSLAAAETMADSTRYRLLETVRQYGADRLEESGQASAARGQHAAWFLALAEQAEQQLAGPQQGAWLTRLETEHDNLRAALTWGGQQPDEETNLRLTGALWRFWQMRGHFSEGRQWLDKALERSADEGAFRLSLAASQARAKTLNGAGVLTYCQGEYGPARGYWEECLALSRQLENPNGMAAPLNNLGHVAAAQGDYGSAQAYYEESLTLRRQSDDQNGIAVTLSNLGGLASKQGDYETAQVLLEESAALYRQIGNPSGIAAAVSNLGEVACAQGEYSLARTLWEESLALDRQIGNPNGIAASLNSLGEAACAEGDLSRARVLLDEGLTLFRQVGNQSGIAAALSNLGRIAAVQGDYGSAQALYEESLVLRRQLGEQQGMAYSLEEMAGVAQGQNQSRRAVRLLGAAAALRDAIGAPLTPREREERSQELSLIRAALEDGVFAESWNAGRAMTLDQAAEYALASEEVLF